MLKIIKSLLLVIACMGLPAMASSTVKETRTISDASRVTIDSKVLDAKRQILIHLPKSYSEANKDYPVLYLLDGGRHFNHAILATQLLQSDGRVPELIIVAITNSDTWGNGAGSRGHDLGYRGKDNFARYIKTEVMPYVDTHYRTTGLNTLFGHSLAGYFTTDLLANQSDLFRNYIVASPGLQGDEVDIYNKLLAAGKAKDAAEKSFYISLASEDEARNQALTDAINSFVKLLTENTPDKLDWHYEFFANQTHITVFYPTFFNGMTSVFNSYQAPRFAHYKEYEAFGGMPAMEAHYKKRAQIYGLDERVPELTLVNLASMLFKEGKLDPALQLYLTLIKDFPESAASYSGLGQVYHLMKQHEQSVNAHQNAVMLAKKFSPNWQQRLYQRRLDTVLKAAEELN